MPGPERSPETKPEYTVADYAGSIRSAFLSTTSELPFFPQCKQYGSGNCPLYVTDQRETPSCRNIIFVLQPDGQIIKMPARTEDHRFHTTLIPIDSLAEPASDIDIVFNGPALISRLYEQTAKQVSEQTEAVVIDNAIQFLSNKSVGEAIYKWSFAAKKLVLGKSTQIEEVKFTDTLDIDHDNLALYEKALEYYSDKGEIVDEAKRLSDMQAIDPIIDFFSELVKRIDNDKLFDNITRYRVAEPGWIKISNAYININSVEIRYLQGTSLTCDPIRVICDAPYIARDLIDKVIKNVFPNLDKEPEEPGF